MKGGSLHVTYSSLNNQIGDVEPEWCDQWEERQKGYGQDEGSKKVWNLKGTHGVN